MQASATHLVLVPSYDTGPILNQCRILVEAGDTVETLSARVLKQEHRLYVETLQKISEGKIVLGQ